MLPSVSAVVQTNGKKSFKISTLEMITAKTVDGNEHKHVETKDKLLYKIYKKFPSNIEYKQYFGVIICGLGIWGTSWFILKDAVEPGGYIFRMTAIIVVGYISGHTLQRFTTLPPLVAMTLVGALYRNLGGDNILDNSIANSIDFHLRRIYPVIILTKGPLGWDWNHIRNNLVRVFSLATIPWIVECCCVAILTHALLNFSWIWGFHLGTILASVSPAVVVPIVMAFDARGLGTKNQIAILVANAGGLDTAFTEALCGITNSFLFYPSGIEYKIIKALLAIAIAIGIGIAWGVLVDHVPEHKDKSAATIRSIIMLSGGILLTYGGGYLGWGGTAGVAVMVCAGTAATRWARRGWPLNMNPIAEVFRILWLIFEPMLFTLSGYHLKITDMTVQEWCLAVSCVNAALLFRLITAFVVCLANRLSVKESIFIAITWIPKAIVEAVLVRVAADSLWTDGSATDQDNHTARMHSNIIVVAIIVTSTLGSAFTTLFGPTLLSENSRVNPQGIYRKSSEENNVRNTSTTSFQCVDIA